MNHFKLLYDLSRWFSWFSFSESELFFWLHHVQPQYKSHKTSVDTLILLFCGIILFTSWMNVKVNKPYCTTIFEYNVQRKINFVLHSIYILSKFFRSFDLLISWKFCYLNCKIGFSSDYVRYGRLNID